METPSAPLHPLLHKLSSGLLSHSPEETHSIAASFAQIIPLNSTVALHGNLGAGKTTFAQGFAQGLGITEPITSPTYTLYSIYKSTSLSLIHLDAYRLSPSSPTESLYLDDLLTPPFIFLVEWPEHAPSLIPKNAFHLHLSIQPNHAHLIQLSPH